MSVSSPCARRAGLLAAAAVRMHGSLVDFVCFSLRNFSELLPRDVGAQSSSMLEADTFVGLVTGHLTLSPDARRHRLGDWLDLVSVLV